MQSEPKTVQMRQSDYALLLSEAKKQEPNEACGLLAGVDEGNLRSIQKVYILENLDHSPEHFSLDPKEQLAAVLDMRKNGWKPLGNWHSHPATPSRPSEEDKRLAFDKSATYMILSLAEAEPVLNAFHIENGESRKEDLKITE